MADTGQKRRWMPLVLGLSLALNFAVVAAVGGAAWRHSGDERRGPHASKGGALYLKALPRETRRAIRDEARSGPRMKVQTSEMLEALRKEPFDPAVASRLLDAERDAGVQRREAVAAAWLTQVTAMNAQERAAYADRLEELSQRGGEKWKERGKKSN